MLTAVEEQPLTQLLQVLWKGKNSLGSSIADDIKIGMSIPHTVVYEHNFPKGLFHAGLDGCLQRRVGKEIDSKTVFGVFAVQNSSNRSGAGSGAEKAIGGPRGGMDVPGRLAQTGHTRGNEDDIVAVYMEKRTDSDQFAAQYFTDEGLRAFLLGSEKQPLSSMRHAGLSPAMIDVRPVQSKNGILQKFLYPIGIHSEIIQVIWTGHLCIAEKLRSRVLLSDTTKSPYQRAATVEAPLNFCERAYLSPTVSEAVRKQCELLVDQLYVVERRLVEQMTLYFKIDETGHLWLLWSPSIKFTKAGAELSNANDGLSTAPKRHLQATIPEFCLPRSCGGGKKSSSAVEKSSSQVARNADTTFRLTKDMTFVSMTEDMVLAVKHPRLRVPCASEKEATSFVLPHESRLCPKLRWLDGKRLSLDYRRYKERSSLLGAAPEDVTVGGSLARPPSQQSAAGSPALARHALAQRTSVDETPPGGRFDSTMSPARRHPTSPLLSQHRSPSPKTASYVQPVYTIADLPKYDAEGAATASGEWRRPKSVFEILRTTAPATREDADSHFRSEKNHTRLSLSISNSSPQRRRAEAELSSNANTGDFSREIALVRSLCRSPLHSAIASAQDVDRMFACKSSMELAAEFLVHVHDAFLEHFLLFPTIPSTNVSCPPMQFSVPLHLFECENVRQAVLELCAGQFAKNCTVTLEKAVEMDRTIGRRGTCDDTSWHHHMLGLKVENDKRAVVQSAQEMSQAADIPLPVPEPPAMVHESTATSAAAVTASVGEENTEDITGPAGLDETAPAHPITEQAEEDQLSAAAGSAHIPVTPKLVNEGHSAVDQPFHEEHDPASGQGDVSFVAAVTTFVELPCYTVPNLSAASSFISKIAPFLVVNLRNCHATVEASLVGGTVKK